MSEESNELRPCECFAIIGEDGIRHDALSLRPDCGHKSSERAAVVIITKAEYDRLTSLREAVTRMLMEARLK